MLLGYGTGDANEWSGVWAVGWSNTSLILLAVLFINALHVIDATHLEARRIRRAREQVDEEVNRVVFERLSHRYLKDCCDRWGVDVEWFGARADGREALKAIDSGEVVDINLRVLQKLGSTALREGHPKPALAVKLGDRVAPDTEWLYGHPEVLRRLRTRTLRRALSVRSSPSQAAQLRRTLDELHEEALLAIAAPAPNRYRTLVEAYTDILLRLPEAWARYGQQLEEDTGVSSGLFDWTFLDTLRSNAYEEALHALAAEDRDIAQEILNFPLDVCGRALPVRAFALVRTGLAMYASYYTALLRSSHPHRDMLRSWMHQRLREFAGHRIEPVLTRDGSSREARTDAEHALSDVFRTFAELIKIALDNDPADESALAELNQEWDSLLRHWEPEYRQPDSWVVERLERDLGTDHPDVLRQREAARENAELVAAKERLLRLRRTHRFGLDSWALRKYMSTREAVWLGAFNSFANYFSDPVELTTTFGDTVRHEWKHHGPWSGWILNELPLGQAHAVSPESDFSTAFTILALRNLGEEGEAPALPLDETVASHFRVEGARASIERVVADPALADLLPEAPAERAERLAEALDALTAAVDRAEEDATIAASPDEQLVSEFKEQVRAQWEAGRLVRAAFLNRGRLQEHEGSAPESALDQVWSWHRKGLFLHTHRIHGHEHVAREVAQALLHRETLDVLKMCGLDEPAEALDGTPAARVRSVMNEMRGAGLDPQVVLIPGRWRLLSDLEVDAASGWGGDLEAPSWIPEGVRGQFRGAIEDVPILTLREVPDDRLAICDFRAVGTWHEWLDDRELRIRVEAFGGVQAREQAEAADADDEPEVVARRIQLAVRVSLRISRDVVLEHRPAVRWIALDAGTD